MSRTAVILVDNLNIRMEPDGEVIGVVRKGQQFPILKSESHPVCDWLQIKLTNDLIGWIAEVNKRDSKRFVRVEDDIDLPPNNWATWTTFGVIIAIVVALIYSCVPA